MKRKIKVLVVDDSGVVRQMLSKILSSDEEIEVIGTASDGIYALEKVKLLSPDVVSLDVEMPRMNGLTFLEQLMKNRPMPVVMVSATTSQGAENTIKALELGAVDFVLKPKENFIGEIGELKEEIISKIKTAANINLRIKKPITGKTFEEKKSIQKQEIKIESKIKDKFDEYLIAIGASTGGTDAITQLLNKLPTNIPPILIVQHMPEYFTSAFAKRLDKVTPFSVKEAQNNDKIQSGQVLIAPGNFHLLVKKHKNSIWVEVNQDEAVNKHRPSIDTLFHSVSEAFKDKAVGVLLTGMGKDGAQGLFSMKTNGAFTLVQDEESSIVFGMPKEAIRLGAASVINNISGIAQEITDHFSEKNS